MDTKNYSRKATMVDFFGDSFNVDDHNHYNSKVPKNQRYFNGREKQKP